VSRTQLQSYYEDRPGRPHRSDVELEALKDGEQITVQWIVYHKKGDEIVVLGNCGHHCNETHPNSRVVVVPSKPVIPMSNC
jgi:hypothetical protein